MLKMKKENKVSLYKGYKKQEINKYYDLLNKIKLIDYSNIRNEEFKDLIQNIKNKDNNEFIINGFAVIKEGVKRKLNIDVFDVQIIGGIVLYFDRLAQMQTGEGKTLTAVFPAILKALNNTGVHILTFNDYLAKRDAEWMGPIYELFGLSVGYITEVMNKEERKKQYNCDITYITAKEAGFDFIRDSIVFDKNNVVQRELHYVIVDEIDSILIDEARVPLVLAAHETSEKDRRNEINNIAKELKFREDYETDENERNVYLTDKGTEKVEKKLDIKNLYDLENIDLLTMINASIHAYKLLRKDKDYIVKNEIVEIIDEFTGRVADKRHLPDGLQAAVEAKEGIENNEKGRILSSTSLQHYIKRYKSISGMTATAISSAEEFMKFYDLQVVVIPENKVSIRKDEPDYIYKTKKEKYVDLVKEVVKEYKLGRPVLLGTASVEESDYLAELLKESGIDNLNVLNAKNDELEAKIIANAGKLHSVTVSTNMAGRGIDIKLGGENERELNLVVELGGLYVIGTNKHESIRIDNQLRGRSGRQGDPGKTRFFISLEDELIVKFGIRKLLPKNIELDDNGRIIDSNINKIINHVQRVIDGQNHEIRKTLWNYSYIIENQRKILLEKRNNILHCLNTSILKEFDTNRYNVLKKLIGEEDLINGERLISLFVIDNEWSEYMAYVEYIKEGIHLNSITGKNPLDEFHKGVIEYFSTVDDKINNEIIKILNNKNIVENNKINFKRFNISEPSSTWTYTISDNYFENNLKGSFFSGKPQGLGAVEVYFTMPFVMVGMIFDWVRKKI